MATTLEFWKQQGLNIVYVSYNHETFKLGEFLRLPEARDILELMYKKIEMDYPYEVKKTLIETVGQFIENHFLDLDKQFDVVILSNGERQKNVIFNIENKYKQTD